MPTAARIYKQTRSMTAKVNAIAAEPAMERPDSSGRFGRFGGKYVPETLISALAELEQAYAEAMNDPEFIVSLNFPHPFALDTPCIISG